MTKRPYYSNETIHCTCGENFYPNLENELESEVGKNDELRDEEEFVCRICGRKYKLEITVECVISSFVNNFESIGNEYYDVNNEVFDNSIFERINIGESINLENGEYEVGDYAFKVEERILIQIFNANVDENQLELEI